MKLKPLHPSELTTLARMKAVLAQPAPASVRVSWWQRWWAKVWRVSAMRGRRA